MSLETNTQELEEILELIENLPEGQNSPVTSVNGQTGNVVITPESIGALPDDTPVVNSVNGKTGVINLTSEDVGALPNNTLIPQKVADLTDGEDYAKKNWVEEIANGRCKAYVFDYRAETDENYLKDSDKENKTVLENWLQIIANVTNLRTGDIFLIRDIGVPDYWWDSESSSKQILETTKVPLEEYATKNELLEELAKKQEPFKITATANFDTGMLTVMESGIFYKITEAYERGDHIYIDCDIGQAYPGRRVLLNLTVFQPGYFAAFENVITSAGNCSLITGMIDIDGTNYFTLANLVPQSQISNFEFVKSSSVPTHVDTNVITFVIEE